MSEEYTKLAPVKFGFAWGLIWALFTLLIGWASWLWSYGQAVVNIMSSVYYGYGPSFLGGMIGAFWGLLDFFVLGWLVALVYNCCCCCCYRKVSCDSSQ